MKQLTTILLALIVTTTLNAQDKWFTRAGEISFHSKTPVENIDAISKTASSVMVQSTGQIQFSVGMKSFVFERALMQEHFNENYVESDKYPKATFKGKLDDVSKVDFETPGTYTVPVSGDLTIHGKTNKVTTDAKLEISKDGIMANATFEVTPQDYDIAIPAMVADKIAKQITVEIKANYQPLKR